MKTRRTRTNLKKIANDYGDALLSQLRNNDIIENKEDKLSRLLKKELTYGLVKEKHIEHMGYLIHSYYSLYLLPANKTDRSNAIMTCCFYKPYGVSGKISFIVNASIMSDKMNLHKFNVFQNYKGINYPEMTTCVELINKALNWLIDSIENKDKEDTGLVRYRLQKIGQDQDQDQDEYEDNDEEEEMERLQARQTDEDEDEEIEPPRRSSYIDRMLKRRTNRR